MNGMVIKKAGRLIQCTSLVLIAGVAGCGINLAALPIEGSVDLTAPAGFCNVTDEGMLVARITNVGDMDAPPTTTRVTLECGFGMQEIRDVATPAIAPGDVVEVELILLRLRFEDCAANGTFFFTIEVDVEDVVEETIEGNMFEGTCPESVGFG